MQDLFYQRIDQSGSPDFTAKETDRLLNWGYDVWYIINRKKFDTDQKNSVNMTHLIRPFSFFAVSEITVVGVGADIPTFRDLAQMRGTFNIADCNGVVSQVENNIVPTPLSVTDVNRSDPYNKPTDSYPMYSQTHNGTFRIIKVESTTTPVSLKGTYFKELQVIDCQNNSTTQFEAQDYIARQIVDMSKILAKGDLDDYAAVKNALQETTMQM